MDLRGPNNLANIIVSLKIFPTGVEVDFNKLQEEIEKTLPPKAKIYADFQTEPIAFGLNALIAHIQIPETETGVIDDVEHSLEKIPEVSRTQTLMVRRTR